MEIHLTEKSAVEFNVLCSDDMTPEEAARYLKEGRIELRTFPETLQNQYPYPDLRLRLVTSLQNYEPDATPESVSRKVNNWLGGRNTPKSREDVFRIAFALDLTEPQLNLLLGQCTDYGIHYRDPQDVIYTWFLRNDLGYEDACNFYQSLPVPPRMSEYPDVGEIHITRSLQNAFLSVYTQEGLRKVYMDHINDFGRLHCRAYRYFEKYMGVLTSPGTDWAGNSEEAYSLERVMDLYLSLHMPSGRNRSGYNVVQKLIRQHWPNATSLKNIHAHKEDVPRKLLLLLYIITENVVDEDYSEADEDYLTDEERMEDHWWMLNAILTDCGMPTMDPRNATDWLVLYALTAEPEPMGDRMSQVIDLLFRDEGQTD